MSNKGSRKGYRQRRTEYDCIAQLFRTCGVPFTETTTTVGAIDDRAMLEPRSPRSKLLVIGFETTSLLFDAKGIYVGREFIARDECDYVKPRDRSVR